MAKFLKLNQVTGEGDYGLTGEAGEDDVPHGPEQITVPVTIVLGADPAKTIRSFTKRKYDKPGTRIVFASGVGLPVVETVEQVEAAIAGLYN